MRTIFQLAIVGLSFLLPYAEGARVKDIAMLRGARNNQLVGYGMVVGLQGTGDKSSELTEGSMALMLKGLGLDPKTYKLETKNAAVVTVTATLPPFTRLGTPLDINISSVGSATSLDGGTLMMTALKGPDGKIYAMAQGKIASNKKAERGGGGPNAQNSVTASLMNGAILEREVAFDFSKEKELRYLLTSPDFTTAVRMSKKINEELGGKYASAIDASTVDVIFPYQFEGTPVELVAQIENVDVETDRRAKVVVNPRTGTVILGDSVRIAPVAIAHSNLKIEVSQPENQVRGVAGQVQQAAAEEASKAGTPSKNKRVLLLSNGTNISEVVMALNEMGATPDDLISLLQSLKAAGALMADLEMQ
jgi:flagellar P-ring protein FlgI